MGAPAGNKFWLKRSKHGRDKIFATPDILLAAAQEYFEYESKKVWNIQEAIKAGEFSGQLVAVPVHNPFTIQGICIFLYVNTKYFAHFEGGIKKTIENKETSPENLELAKDFSNVISYIHDVIDKQKIDGALIGAYNPSLTSKIVGLTEKTETALTGKDGAPIETNSNLTVTVVSTLAGLSKSEKDIEQGIINELNANE